MTSCMVSAQMTRHYYQEEWPRPGLHLLDSAQINQSANWVPGIFPQAQQETVCMGQWNNKFKTKFAFIIPLRGVYLQQYWCMSIIISLQLLDDSHKLQNSHREEFIWSVGARCVVVIPDIKENVSSCASQKTTPSNSFSLRITNLLQLRAGMTIKRNP